jgi:hypothetical protein
MINVAALPFLSHRYAVRADARPVPVTCGRRLKTLRGTLDQGAQAGDA